jgi:tryptophan-rich sensory protein
MAGFSQKDALGLVASVAACELAGVIGTVFTAPAIGSWYAALNKPFFTPPNWAFAPVWISLYALMGISLFLVWRKGAQEKISVGGQLYVFGAQLALNVLWSAAFFGLRSPLAGLLVIAALWAAIAATVFQFRKVSRAAAWLLVPYILWVTIALLLNLSVALYN